MGAEMADEMLNKGRKLSADEAFKAGMIDGVVAEEELLERTQAHAEKWVSEGRPRQIDTLEARQMLKEVNERESRELAEAFLSESFFQAMQDFTRDKKPQASALFRALRLTRPVWYRFI